MERRSFLQMGACSLATAGLGGSVTGSTLEDEPSFEPLGSIDVQGAKDAAVHHESEVVYVAAGDGFVSIDISTPSEPELLAEKREIQSPDGDQLELIWDCWPWEDRLVVAGPAQPTSGTAFGFALFDIADPAAPEQVAYYDTTDDHYIHNTFFAEGIVYLTGSGIEAHPLVMIDVTDDEPEEVGRWSFVEEDERYSEIPVPMRQLHDVYVQDEIAYLPYWDAGTWIVDVSDPADPDVLSRVGDYELAEAREFSTADALTEVFVPPGNDHYTQVNEAGTILAVGKEAWDIDEPGVSGGAGDVVLYDVEDKTAPEEYATIEAPDSFAQTQNSWFTTAHNLDFQDDRLYTSWYFGGVKIHDISDPENPEEVAWWREPREASFWTAQAAGDVFVASSADLSAQMGDELNETDEALYIFPDEAGEQPDPPSLVDRPTDIFPTEAEHENGDGQNETGGSEQNGEDDIHGDTTHDGENESGDGDEEISDDGFGPGFGIATAAAGLGGGYLLARRGQNSDED